MTHRAIPDLRGLTIIPRRAHDGDGRRSWRQIVLASYHRRDSITWRWTVYWQPCWVFVARVIRHNTGGWSRLGVPFFGKLDLCWQDHMPRWTPEDRRRHEDEIEAFYSPVPDHMPEDWQ